VQNSRTITRRLQTLFFFCGSEPRGRGNWHDDGLYRAAIVRQPLAFAGSSPVLRMLKTPTTPVLRCPGPTRTCGQLAASWRCPQAWMTDTPVQHSAGVVKGLATPSPALSTGPAATPRRPRFAPRRTWLVPAIARAKRKAGKHLNHGDRAQAEPSGRWRGCPERAHTTRTPPEARQRRCLAVTMARRSRAAVGRSDNRRDGESQPPHRGRGGRQLEEPSAYPLSRARSLCFFYLFVTPPLSRAIADAWARANGVYPRREIAVGSLSRCRCSAMICMIVPRSVAL
jgi:hypothetical protein